MTTFQKRKLWSQKTQNSPLGEKIPPVGRFSLSAGNMWSGSAWKKEPEFVLNRWPFDRQYAIFKANN